MKMSRNYCMYLNISDTLHNLQFSWPCPYRIRLTLLFFYVFVLCIVTQLCNVNQHVHTFQINVLVQFLASLHVSNIMCSSSGRPLVHAVLYGTFFVHLCKQSNRWKDVLDTKKCTFVGLRYIIV
jgi:hypothetical protein